MSKALKAEKPVSLAQLAQEAFQAAGGDMPTAANKLAAAIMADQQMLAEVMPVAVRSWAAEMVRTSVSMMRVKAIASVAHDTTQRGGRLRVVVTATLFDFPLPGGKRLGDANAAEILNGASDYQEQADDMAHKARWLIAVADRVGTANRADTALSLPELETLFEEAKHA